VLTQNLDCRVRIVSNGCGKLTLHETISTFLDHLPSALMMLCDLLSDQKVDQVFERWPVSPPANG
jgi:hypothetical protein